MQSYPYNKCYSHLELSQTDLGKRILVYRSDALEFGNIDRNYDMILFNMCLYLFCFSTGDGDFQDVYDTAS